MLAAGVVLWENRNMESNPMLEKAWRIKNEWACQASDDTHLLRPKTRMWAAS
jgi:hypothetical protein